MNRSHRDPLVQVLRSPLSRRALVRSLVSGGTSALVGTTQPSAGDAAAQEATPIGFPGHGAEILWDTWGVPHVYATDAPGLFYGFGWAQAHAHGDLLLRLYAQSRGRGSEYLGEAFLVADRAVRTMGLVHHAEAWYRAQTLEFRANLDAFAAGINAYGQAHPEALDDRVAAVLPVTAVDVLAHTARILYLFVAGTSGALEALPGGSAFGSNGWAVAPAHTARGNALLLANPHLYWSEEQIFFEAQLSAPGVYDAYGATLVGMPVLAIAFNDRLGWTHTVNTIDAGDLYQLTLAEGGYRFDGAVREFETRTETIRVRQEGGSLRKETLEVRQSVHGPVVEHEGATIALRLAPFAESTSAAGSLEQWWDMGRAGTLAEFESAVARLQVPLFTVIYADADGHVLSLFNGQVPLRPTVAGVDWWGLVPGDTAATLWTEIHPYSELPRVADPPSGWVQNSNSAPWYTTYPMVLDPGSFPPYMAPQFLGWRERRGIRMLEENPDMTLERLIELKHSTRMEFADRVLDELIDAARRSGDPAARRAADTLAGWDRQANADSTGVLLFAAWVQAVNPQDPFLYDLFATPADLTAPLTTPAGLADPEEAVRALVTAAGQVEAAFGRLDVPWGEVARMRRGLVDEPANGFPGDPLGVFRTLLVDVMTIRPDAPASVVGGETFIATVEFGDPVRAQVLTTYGNASQPGSPHVGDQLVLAARGELRPAWRTRAEVEGHLEMREVLPVNAALPASTPVP